MNYDQENCPEDSSNTEDKPLDEQLNKLRTDLLESQESFQKATSEIAEHEAQIEALGKFIAEYDQIIANYKEALPALLEKQSTYEKICKDEKSCLESILGETCAPKVCDIVDEINQEIVELENEIKEREDALTSAKELRDENEETRDEAKATFDQLKDPKKSIEDRFKSLAQLKTEIDKKRDEHQNTIAYYLLTCKDKFCPLTCAEPKVYELKDFIEILKGAWNDYVKADSCFSKQDALVKGLEKQLETRKTQLEEDKTNLETRIRRKLSELAESPDCSKETEPNKSYET